MSMFKTYDHTKVNISFNGIALTDFNGDPTISKEGPEFEVVEGSNGAVERSRMVKQKTVSIPETVFVLVQYSPSEKGFSVVFRALKRYRKIAAAPFFFLGGF